MRSPAKWKAVPSLLLRPRQLWQAAASGSPPATTKMPPTRRLDDNEVGELKAAILRLNEEIKRRGWKLQPVADEDSN